MRVGPGLSWGPVCPRNKDAVFTPWMVLMVDVFLLNPSTCLCVIVSSVNLLLLQFTLTHSLVCLPQGSTQQGGESGQVINSRTSTASLLFWPSLAYFGSSCWEKIFSEFSVLLFKHVLLLLFLNDRLQFFILSRRRKWTTINPGGSDDNVRECGGRSDPPVDPETWF